MQWVDRVNGNGKQFRQWQTTASGERPPDWPTAAQPGCPVCGEEYAHRMLTTQGTWVVSQREHIYHDRERHADYPVAKGDRVVEANDLRVPREPGE